MTAGHPCPVCGTPRRAEAVFCHNCGAPLTENPSASAAPEAVETLPASAEPAATVTPTATTSDYAFCPRCGTTWVEGAEFCFNCGFQRASTAPVASQPGGPAAPMGLETVVRAAVGPVPAFDSEPPKGKVRNLYAFVGLMLVTLHLYLFYWVYQTYKEVRAHSPDVTNITPGRALGFLFIPLFNVFWIFRLVFDITRSVSELQTRHPLGEGSLNKSLATGLVVAGWILLQVGGYLLDWRVLISGEPLFLGGFLLVQHALNQHWARHSAESGAVV